MLKKKQTEEEQRVEYSLNYEELLRHAQAQLPESAVQKERFEVPKAICLLEGPKTIVTNFSQICSILRREPAHLLKYLQHELATPAHIDGQRLILGRKLLQSFINEKIEVYARDFVICPECKKPDTKLVKEDRVLFIKCMACGAKAPVKTKI